VKPDRRLVHGLGTGIGCHDDDDVAEISLSSVVVGQGAVVHDLQQHIEDVRMGLFDFIQQQHTMRFFGHRFGQQATLIKTHVARGRTDQPAHRMALHVLAHVKAHQVDAHDVGELLGRLGLAHARGALKTKTIQSVCRHAPNLSAPF